VLGSEPGGVGEWWREAIALCAADSHVWMTLGSGCAAAWCEGEVTWVQRGHAACCLAVGPAGLEYKTSILTRCCVQGRQV
jgi:hypothetical protein